MEGGHSYPQKRNCLKKELRKALFFYSHFSILS